MLRYSKYLMLLGFILIASCSNEKDGLINTYEALYSNVVSADFDSIENFLDHKSLNFYYKITDTSNLTIPKILEIGKKYRLSYLTIIYLATYGEHMKTNSKKSEFFRFLGLNQVSFFSFFDAYKSIKEKATTGVENFIPIQKTFKGTIKEGWVKFSKENETFRLDLIYTLQLKEGVFRKLHRAKRLELDNLSFEEYLMTVYEAHGRLTRNIAAEDDLIQKRKEAVKELNQK